MFHVQRLPFIVLKGFPEHRASVWDPFKLCVFIPKLKKCMSDSVTNYIYVGDTKISVSIKKTNAH